MVPQTAHAEWWNPGESAGLPWLTSDIPFRGAKLGLVLFPSPPPPLSSVSIGSRLGGFFPTGFRLFWIAALTSQIVFLCKPRLECDQSSKSDVFFGGVVRRELREPYKEALLLNCAENCGPTINYLLITRVSLLFCFLT